MAVKSKIGGYEYRILRDTLAPEGGGYMIQIRSCSFFVFTGRWRFLEVLSDDVFVWTPHRTRATEFPKERALAIAASGFKGKPREPRYLVVWPSKDGTELD